MLFKDFLNHNIIESGNSASEVKWRREGNYKIGEFTVSNRYGNGTYSIVISKKEKHYMNNITDLELYEFKFYDPEGSIELTNKMDFVLGVGPTIINEFKEFLKTEPEAVIFTADKHEKSRVKHYDKFTDKVAKEFGYIPFYKTAITSNDDEYVLVRQDKIQSFKNNFNTTNI